jgi:hypothetical protein
MEWVIMEQGLRGIGRRWSSGGVRRWRSCGGAHGSSEHVGALLPQEVRKEGEMES